MSSLSYFRLQSVHNAIASNGQILDIKQCNLNVKRAPMIVRSGF